MILGLLSLLILVFSVHQIMLFYNIQINFFGIYLVFYGFMIICIWMFNESSELNDIKGLVFQINMLNSTALSKAKVIHSSEGDMTLTTDV